MTELKKVEDLINKSGDVQKKGITEAVDDALSKKDIQTLEKITQCSIILNQWLVLSNHQFAGSHSTFLEVLATGLEKFDKEKLVEFAPKLLEIMSSKTLANEKNEYRIRKAIAAGYSYMEDPKQAVKTLSNMHIDQIKEKIGIPSAVEGFVIISDYCLDDKNSADAYSYITKAAQYIDEVTDIKIICKYKYCYAQVHDANLKFGQAASLYYDLSQKGSVGVPEEETKNFLSRAMICTILAPPGTQRSRLLTILYKDERTRIISHFNLLEKMYLERLIKMEEVAKFEEDLQPHQKGMTAENYSVLQKAVLEHNVLALSKIYTNIALEQLCKLLQLPLDKVELLVASMINEGKIKAHINQADQFVYFDAEKEMIQRFNELIGSLCDGINQLIQETSQKYPNLEGIAKS